MFGELEKILQEMSGSRTQQKSGQEEDFASDVSMG